MKETMDLGGTLFPFFFNSYSHLLSFDFCDAKYLDCGKTNFLNKFNLNLQLTKDSRHFKNVSHSFVFQLMITFCLVLCLLELFLVDVCHFGFFLYPR